MRTPGGKSVCSATSRPSRVAFHGVSGAGLRITVLPVARACPSLFSVTSSGKFHGHDRADHADRLLPDLARVRGAAAVDDLAAGRSARELVDELDRVAERAVERDVELVGVGGHPRAAHLEDELLAQLLAVLLERLLQLGQAALAQLAVGRPRPSRRRRGGRASMARCMSAFDASATCPMTSSVAGLMLSKVWPVSDSTSSPSTSILTSWSSSVTEPPSWPAHCASGPAWSATGSGPRASRWCKSHYQIS